MENNFNNLYYSFKICEFYNDSFLNESYLKSLFKFLHDGKLNQDIYLTCCEDDKSIYLIFLFIRSNNLDQYQVIGKIPYHIDIFKRFTIKEFTTLGLKVINFK